MYPPPHMTNTLCGNSPNADVEEQVCEGLRRGDKWIDIRKLTDVGPSFQVGWIIELEWLGICRVTEVPMQA